MYLPDARNKLRLDLMDTDEEAYLLQNDDLDRAIERAVSDLSRFLPRDLVFELTLLFTVTNEAWTSAAAAGTYVTLAHKPIKLNSETVKNDSGVSCLENADYYLDYTSGKITHISGGLIGNGKSCTISYTRSQVTMDIGSILNDLIRIERVEYPLGSIPQTFVTFDVHGYLLSITGDFGSQFELTENNHLAIYYKAKHTSPTIDAEGSYPSFLDGTVILAANAYALFALAIRHEHLASIDLVSSRTALTASIAALVLAATAMDKVDTYLAGASESTKALLAQIATDAGNLRTAIETAVDAVATYLTGASAPSAKKYLDDGDALINEATKGDNVCENYATFAQACVAIANGLISEAAIRLNNLRAYIEQANAYATVADGFIAEAQQRISAAASYIAEASDRYALSGQELALADKYRTEAIERRNEAWAIWRDPSQYIGDYVAVALQQSASSE